MKIWVPVVWGVIGGILILNLIFTLLIGPTSLREIGTPCRHHGGVAQYQSKTFFDIAPVDLYGVVVCRDGKIGEIK